MRSEMPITSVGILISSLAIKKTGHVFIFLKKLTFLSVITALCFIYYVEWKFQLYMDFLIFLLYYYHLFIFIFPNAGLLHLVFWIMIYFAFKLCNMQ